MITANELRIGNLVNFHNDDTIFEVLGIHRNPDGIDCKSKHEETYIGLEHFSPIPLTEQILLKCGFEKVYESDFRIKFDYLSDNSIGYSFDLTDDRTTGMHGVSHYGRYYKCEYLHSLQNFVYSLIGQEIKIDL